MERLFLECAVRAALLIGAIAIVLYTMRVRAATARHSVWSGVVALMLDEAVGWAAWHAGHPGVTGRLQVSYRRPLKLGEPVRVVGKVENIRRTLVYASAVIENRDDGSRIADATATLMMAETKVDPAS